MTSTIVPQNVLAKLFVTTASMIILPITSYFMTLDAFWNGSQTKAAATAAIVANVILAVFVFNALTEQTPPSTKSSSSSDKKSQ